MVLECKIVSVYGILKVQVLLWRIQLLETVLSEKTSNFSRYYWKLSTFSDKTELTEDQQFKQNEKGYLSISLQTKKMCNEFNSTIFSVLSLSRSGFLSAPEWKSEPNLSCACPLHACVMYEKIHEEVKKASYFVIALTKMLVIQY